MGPGFDSFGFAVDLENELVLERGAFKVDIIGEGETSLPRDQSNAIIKAVKDGYAAIYPDEHLPIDDIKFTSVNRIPPARGLGSSSAALVAGLAAGLGLAGQDLAKPQTKQLLLQLAADAEGHPDNVAPAIYGGFQVSINTGKQWVTQAIGLPKGMQAVLFIPEFESLTSETRAALRTEGARSRSPRLSSVSTRLSPEGKAPRAVMTPARTCTLSCSTDSARVSSDEGSAKRPSANAAS